MKCKICGEPMKFYNNGCWCTACDFGAKRKQYKRTLTDNQLELLLTRGITDEIRGLYNSSGEKFNACLKMDEHGNVRATKLINMTSTHRCIFCGKSLVHYCWGYSCDMAHGGCGFSIGSFLGKKLSETQITRLLNRESRQERKYP